MLLRISKKSSYFRARRFATEGKSKGGKVFFKSVIDTMVFEGVI